MDLQKAWQAAKRNEAERQELNALLQKVPGILGCWNSHLNSSYERTTFTLWGTWEGGKV